VLRPKRRAGEVRILSPGGREIGVLGRNGGGANRRQQQGREHERFHGVALGSAAVPGALDHATLMHGDGRIDQIAAQHPKPRQRAIFIRAGEPAVTNNVGHQDRCQFSCLGHLRLSGPQATVAQSAVQAAEKILCGWTAAGLGRLSFHTIMEATDAVRQRSIAENELRRLTDPRNGRAARPGRSLRAIAAEMQAKGHKISHEGVQGVLKGQRRLG
jgi:hypothetical protein